MIDDTSEPSATPEQFKSYWDSIGLAPDTPPERGPHYLTFDVGGGVNTAYFSFISLSGTLYYPARIATAGASRYSGPATEMNGSAIITSDNIFSREYFGLRINEYFFNSRNTNHTRPVWRFSVSWLLPASITKLAAGVGIRDFVRLNSADGVQPTPTVKLYESYLDGNEVKTRLIINHTLAQNEMAERNWLFE